MRLRPHRRYLMVWTSPARPAGRHGALRSARPPRSRRIRRWMHTGVLLAAVGLIRIAAAVRPRWRLLLPGVTLTVAGVILRSGPVSVVLLPGMLFLVSAVLVPAVPEAARRQHRELEHELAAYSTPAQRRDLEATLDRYPDGDTRELRDILARHTVAADSRRFPGRNRGG